MSWATIEQTVGFTGKTLEQSDLDIASSIITLYAGVFEDQPENSILVADRFWLAMACAYQAVWMKPRQATLLEYRESHTSNAVDGESTQRSSDADIMLAPLAARALRNLSWIGTHATLTLPDVSRVKGMVNPLLEVQDELNRWRSLAIS